MPASRHHGKGFACNFQAPHSAFLSAKGQDVRKILKRKDSDTGEKVIDEGYIAQQSFWMFLLIDSWLFRHAIVLLSRFCSNN
ncbi:hypothetical protein AHAS_Ahas19G0284700 [Arachis hypogaea]